MIDKPLTKEELWIAVKHFHGDKTPGVDGIAAQFYKDFWEHISDDYFEAIQYTYQHNRLHISACGGCYH